MNDQLTQETASPAMARARTAGLDSSTVIAGCLMFTLVVFLSPILNDGDTLWQIRTGAWILDHHNIPTADPFSFTAGGRFWFAHEWLSESLLALAFRIGGMQGVMVLAAAAAGLAAATLLHYLRQFLPGIYATMALIVAMANAAPSMLARPHLLALPCLALWCGGLVSARAARTAPSCALLPVMVLWVNLHGSFMLGLLLPIAFLIEALCDSGVDLRQVFVSWGRFIVSACPTASNWSALYLSMESHGRSSPPATRSFRYWIKSLDGNGWSRRTVL